MELLNKLKNSLNTVNTVMNNEEKELILDEYLLQERNPQYKNFVLAVSHLSPTLMSSIINTYIIYSRKPSKTLRELVQNKTEKVFELNGITYNYIGDFNTQDPFGNKILVPMFQEMGKTQLVELDLDLEINRTF